MRPVEDVAFSPTTSPQQQRFTVYYTTRRLLDRQWAASPEDVPVPTEGLDMDLDFEEINQENRTADWPQERIEQY